MAFDTFMVYVGVYPDVDGAEADYDLIKDLHYQAGLIDAYDAAVIQRREDNKVRSSASTRPRPGLAAAGRATVANRRPDRWPPAGTSENITPPTSRPTNQDHLTLPQPQSPTFPLRHLGSAMARTPPDTPSLPPTFGKGHRRTAAAAASRAGRRRSFSMGEAAVPRTPAPDRHARR